MPSYAAFLGHQPHISIAELSAAIPGFAHPVVVGGSVVLFESSAELAPEDIDMLGGTVALAKKLNEQPKSLADVPHLLRQQFAGIADKKVTFSFRCAGLPPGDVKKLYHNAKAFLKSFNLPSRYLGSETNPAAAVLVHDAGLLTDKTGCELTIIGSKEGKGPLSLWVGKTIAVQDVEGYTKRDMHKPVRDARVGLLPPKLAQVLLNFGIWLTKDSHVGLRASKETLRIFDPFCGTGVIPMECLLRGFEVLASDTSEKAVTGCKKNLDWIRKEHDVSKKDVKAEVWKHDARKAFAIKEKDRPDVIVTEGSLGPALTKQAAIRDAQSMAREVDDLTEAFLKNVHESLPGVHVVMTWPVWQTSKGPVYLENVRKKIHDCGFQLITPASVRSEKMPRGTLLYKRPDQFVGREIVILKAKTK
jgi:hypothetical protein